MKNTRNLAAMAGALVLVSGVASLTLLGGGGASAAGQPSSAFGLELNLAGNAAIPPTPAVESTDGALTTDTLVDLPIDPLLDAGLVNVSAQNGAAEASVADLSVVGLNGPLAAVKDLGTQLQPVCDALSQIPLGTILNQAIDPVTGTLLPALLQPLVDATAGTPIDLSLVTALDLSKVLPADLGTICDFALSGNLVGADAVVASCTGDTGNVVIEGLNGLVGSLVDTNKPNSAIAIDGLVEVVVNRQTANADGTFTVDALYVNLLDQIELTVASATCGEVAGVVDTPDPSDAPTPTPTPTHVPVTG